MLHLHRRLCQVLWRQQTYNVHFDTCVSNRCKCEMLVQISGEEDRKIDVSYVAYRFFRGSIDNSDCTDQRRCSSLCRGHSKFRQALGHLSVPKTRNRRVSCIFLGLDHTINREMRSRSNTMTALACIYVDLRILDDIKRSSLGEKCEQAET